MSFCVTKHFYVLVFVRFAIYLKIYAVQVALPGISHDFPASLNLLKGVFFLEIRYLPSSVKEAGLMTKTEKLPYAPINNLRLKGKHQFKF